MQLDNKKIGPTFTQKLGVEKTSWSLKRWEASNGSARKEKYGSKDLKIDWVMGEVTG